MAKLVITPLRAAWQADTGNSAEQTHLERRSRDENITFPAKRDFTSDDIKIKVSSKTISNNLSLCDPIFRMSPDSLEMIEDWSFHHKYGVTEAVR